MSRYPLQDMIRVREHREDRASKALTAARQKVIEARKHVEDCQREVDDYHQWRLKEEERLIQSIMRKPVKVGDITDLKLEIANLREREMALKDKVHQAEAALDRALEEEEKARQAHRQALQDLEKLVEHRIEWLNEQRLEAERLADLENEDFQGRRPGLSLNLEPGSNANYELN